MHIKDHATAQGWFRRHAAAPSSKGAWKAFVARNNRTQEPRTMAHEPRNMYAGGQLVTPSADGSRPGYQGPHRRVLGKPTKIDGKEYKKVLEGPDKGKYAIREGTNNPRQFVKKSEIRKTVKSNFEKGREHLKTMYEGRSKLSALSTKNRNNWIKNWIKNNINEYGVREFDNFQTDLLNGFNKELKNNPKKYPEWQGTVRVSDDLPIIGDPSGKNTIVIDDINFPRYDQSEGRTQKRAYKKLFYKNKLKDKNFKAKVNTYLDWNLTRKFEGGAGSMTKTAALDYGKLIKGIDDDVVFFMGEVLNERALNPGGGQIGIHDIFRDVFGKKANSYFKKYQGSWGRWTNNFYDVAKLAGLDQSQAKALMQKQINDTQKIMKVYNVKKLPLEFMVAQDHIMGLAEAKALGDPKIAAQTLKNLVASTREQNRYLGQEGFSTKRKALINKFKKAPPNAKGPIVAELNTLADEFVPGRLKYDVRKDGSLKITNLQPETTLKAKKAGYETLSKEFPKKIQKILGNKVTSKEAGFISADMLKDFGKMGVKGLKLLNWLQFEYDVAFESLIYDYHRRYEGDEPDVAREALWLPKILAKYFPDLKKVPFVGGLFEKYETPIMGGPEMVYEKRLHEIKGTEKENLGKVIGDKKLVKSYIDNNKRMEELNSEYRRLEFKKKAPKSGRMDRGSMKEDVAHPRLDPIAKIKNQQATLKYEYNQLEKLNKPDSLSGYHSAYTTALEAQDTERGVKRTEAHKERVEKHGGQARFERDQANKRKKAMEDKFPSYSKAQIDKILKTSGYVIDPNIAKYKKDLKFLTKEDIPNRYKPAFPPGVEAKPLSTYDTIRGILSDEDKLRYYADNFRTEKAQGGIMSLKKKK